MASRPTMGSDSQSESPLSREYVQLQGFDAEPPLSRSTETLLYTSHALSSWNSRLFEFAAFIFLASMYPSTLLPASIYALVRAASAAVLSPWLGLVIDRYDRLSVVRLSIAGGRTSTLLSCLVFFAMAHSPEVRTSRVGFALSLLVLSMLACLEKLSSVLNTISVERDWVVAIAQNDEPLLTRLNARMRRIDLFCKLVAPLAVSFLDTYSTSVAIAVTGAINGLSCAIEYLTIARVYLSNPALRCRKTPSHSDKSTLSHGLFRAAKTYASSSVMLPSLALSFLYLTVLSFAGQLITLLLAKPISLSPMLLSITRGVAACIELSVTFVAPRLIAKIGPVRAGSWFLNSQLLCIGIAAAAFWFPAAENVRGHTAVLIIAVILSRFGLWGFDLSAQQQIQADVPETSRGAFSAVEAALQNAFEMTSFAATIIWSRPEQFKYPATFSALAVLMASMLYAAHVRKCRGHLLHWDEGLCGGKYWQTHFGKKSAFHGETREGLLQSEDDDG